MGAASPQAEAGGRAMRSSAVQYRASSAGSRVEPSRLFLTVTDVARLLECDPRTVRAGVAAGTIPSIRIGNTIRIPSARFYAEVAGIPTDGGDMPNATAPTR